MLYKIDVGIMTRIAQHLQQKGKIKRTKLAMICNMNYTALIEYLVWIKKFNLVTIGRHVQLTDAGREVLT